MHKSILALSLLTLSIAGCGSDSPGVMPDVKGKKLDAAKSTISDASIDDEVKVEGGGTSGVVNESNWQVCSQSPAPGAAVTGAPQLTVDRSCSSGPETSTPSTLTETTPATPAPSATEPAADPVLTKSGNRDFAEFLNVGDGCDPPVGPFVEDHEGETIRFNGSIINPTPHGNAKTRYDILVAPGNDGPNATRGPNLMFEDVSVFDLRLEGDDVPDTISEGDRFLFEAEIESYSGEGGCLVLLDPVSTVAR